MGAAICGPLRTRGHHGILPRRRVDIERVPGLATIAQCAARRVTRRSESRDYENFMPTRNDDAGASGISRRLFLKGALASSTLGVAGLSLLTAGARAAPPVSREVLTGCHWGAFRTQVENGRMTSI